MIFKIFGFKGRINDDIQIKNGRLIHNKIKDRKR